MNAPLRYLVLTTTVVIAGLALGLKLKSKPADPQKQFIGQEACISCHTGAYGDGRSYAGAAAFRETMHQKIHLRPNPQTVVIDRLFAKDTILRFYESRIPDTLRDTLEIHLSKGEQETQYYIQMKFSNGGDSTQKMPVAYTYGGNGWIQRYLLQVNGNLYVAPFQYALPHYKERSDTAVNGFYFLDLTRWYTFDNDRNGKFYDINSKVFKTQSWQMNCAPCHINGFQMDRVITPTDSTPDTSYVTKWYGVEQKDSALIDQNIKVGCESCHGPGSAHAANPSDSTAIISPSRWAADGPGQFTNLTMKLDLCGQCHNRMKSTGIPGISAPTFQFAMDEVNMQPYSPGQPLKNFVFKGDIFNGMNVWGDDTTSYAHHQQGQDFMRSVEFSKHSLVNGCWSCHTVHYANSNGLPFQLRANYYSLNKGEGCLAYGCHETMDETTTFKGQTVNKHTMHTLESSQCVYCHFTKTATISFVDLPRKPLYDFTDHSLKVLRPSMTRRYQTYGAVGMLNTCAEACHRNGRGSRNSDPSMPEAPSYGIVDQYLSIWNNKQDVQLADSLEAHWNELFPASATMESSVAAMTGIQSIAPNPTRNSSTIHFSLAKGGDITLAIYDTEGNLISLVATGRHEAGTFSQVWNGTDETGVQVPSGTYLVRLVTKQGVSTQRLVIAR